MHSNTRRTQTGFTLIELLVTMTISSVLLAAVYQIFHAQQRSHTVQSSTAEMQQGIRASMQLLSRELRSAGYNPTHDITAGFVTSLPEPNNTFVVDYATDRHIVAFTTDDNGNGVIEANEQEQMSYRLNTTTKTLERFKAADGLSGGQWEPVVNNVDALHMLYFDADGAQTSDPAEIRTIEIALLVRASKPDFHYVNQTVYRNMQGQVLCSACLGDHYHRSLLTTTIQVRNAGL